MHHSIIDLTYDTIVFIVLGVTFLRLFFRLRKKVMRDSSKSISNQGGEDKNKDFKISTKEEINIKNRYIVERKITRFIEQGFYSNFKTLRWPISN